MGVKGVRGGGEGCQVAVYLQSGVSAWLVPVEPRSAVE